MKLRLGGKWWQYKTSRKLTASAGYCDYAKQCVVVDELLKDEERLDVEIHECLHACDTNRMISEEWILQTGTELAAALYKLGYRKEA
jgi:hypothetical protein